MENRKAFLPPLKLWAALMVSYCAAGLIERFWLNGSLVLWINLIFTGICLAMAQKEKEGLKSLGLVKEKFKSSLTAGMVCSVIIVLVNAVIPGALSGAELASPGRLIFQFLYFMIFISIPEEMIFRGYLLNRLEQGENRKYMGVVVSGILFMLLHIPYQVVMSGGILNLILNGYLVTLFMTFVWHIVFCILLKKTGAIYGSILFHGVMDWSNYLFI